MMDIPVKSHELCVCDDAPVCRDSTCEYYWGVIPEHYDIHTKFLFSIWIKNRNCKAFDKTRLGIRLIKKT